MSISWIFLLLAGFFEVCFTISLKYSNGFTRLIPSITTVVFMVLSFFSVAQSMKTIPIGTAYAVWAGMGAVGTVTCGIIFFWRFISYYPFNFDLPYSNRYSWFKISPL